MHRHHWAFMGTSTGMASELGKIADLLATAQENMDRSSGGGLMSAIVEVLLVTCNRAGYAARALATETASLQARASSMGTRG
jgi:hypothetical protein